MYIVTVQSNSIDFLWKPNPNAVNNILAPASGDPTYVTAWTNYGATFRCDLPTCNSFFQPFWVTARLVKSTPYTLTVKIGPVTDVSKSTQIIYSFQTGYDSSSAQTAPVIVGGMTIWTWIWISVVILVSLCCVGCCYRKYKQWKNKKLAKEALKLQGEQMIKKVEEEAKAKLDALQTTQPMYGSMPFFVPMMMSPNNMPMGMGMSMPMPMGMSMPYQPISPTANTMQMNTSVTQPLVPPYPTNVTQLSPSPSPEPTSPLNKRAPPPVPSNSNFTDISTADDSKPQVKKGSIGMKILKGLGGGKDKDYKAT